MARSANREAVACFEQALQALRTCPRADDTRVLAIDLRLELRNALLRSGELGRILALLREAEALAQALDDQPAAGAGLGRMANVLLRR